RRRRQAAPRAAAARVGAARASRSGAPRPVRRRRARRHAHGPRGRGTGHRHRVVDRAPRRPSASGRNGGLPERRRVRRRAARRGPGGVSHAIVLADGAAPSRASLDAAWPGWDAGRELVIAADGGAKHATSLGLRLDRWVGDGDSIDPGDLAALAAAWVPVDRVAREKDASDTELAVLAAIEAGAGERTAIGGLGGVRIDHALTNVALLEHPALAGRPAGPS